VDWSRFVAGNVCCEHFPGFVFFRCISDNDVICDWRSWCYLTKVLLCVKYLFAADNATTNTVYSCKKKRCQSNLA